MNTKRLVQTCITAIIAVFMLTSGRMARSETPEDVYTVKIGASPVVSSSAIFLALENGHFSDLGMAVDVIPFKKSGAPMTVLLSSGQLDVGGGNLSTGLWNAINQGIDIKLVADKGHIEKGRSYITLLVRKDHIESGRYKSFKDLKGFKMGLTSLNGVSQQIAAERFLKEGGLSLSDVEFVKMPYSEMNLCLAGKTLDATVQLEPYVAKAELDGSARKAAEVYEVYPDQQSAAIFYSAEFIEKHPDLAKKFMIAYLKGVRDYENAFVNGINKQQTIDSLKKHIKVQDDAVWNNMIPIGLNPDGFINKQSLANDINWYKEHGYINTVPDIDRVVDHSYVENALKEIGEYRK